MKKIKVKKHMAREKFTPVYIGDYQWPSALDALKGFILYFHHIKKSELKSSEVHPSFIKDVVSGAYDDHHTVEFLVGCNNSKELQNVSNTSFNALMKSDPELIGWAWQKMRS